MAYTVIYCTFAPYFYNEELFMNIAIVGTGYVGLVTGACFAETGANIVCVDVNKKRLKI